MAKTRKATKQTRSPRAKSTKKPAARKPPAKRPAKSVALKDLRKEFAAVLDAMTNRRSAAPDVSAKLDDTRRRVSQWMTDIDAICASAICGPDMIIPVS
jgi:hypothetical protein